MIALRAFWVKGFLRKIVVNRLEWYHVGNHESIP
ncbi:MAG: hypothetical protein H6Q83_1425, partial [Deltaproteobacteria bacterium]|nr:hypothetical protein [Deltaproteobacteria bacterium]